MIFQTCLNKATYPKTWRQSKVSPILKEGNRADVTFYHPINLLCFYTKVSEKLLFDAICDVVRDQLQTPEKTFRKDCSATLELLVLLDKLFALYDDDTHNELTVLQ